MTNLITLTIPNDDHVALRAFGKALEEMALVRGAEPRLTEKDVYYPVENYMHMYHADTDVYRLARSDNEVAELLAEGYVQHTQAQYDAWEPKRNRDVETDTTAQPAAPGATHVITEQVKVGAPVLVDGGLSQGYIIKTEEIDNTTDSTGTPWDERIHSASKALNSDGSWRLRRKPKTKSDEEWSEYVKWVMDDIHMVQQAADESTELQPVTYNAEQEPINLNYLSINDIPEPPMTPSGEKLCIDEGCDHHDTPHICVTGIEPPVTLSDAVNASIEVVHAGMSQEFGTGIANAAFTGDRNEPPSVAGIPPIPVPPPVVVPPAYVTNEWDFPKLMKFLTERHGRITVEEVNGLLAVDGLAALTDLNAHPDKIGPFVARVKAHLGE